MNANQAKIAAVVRWVLTLAGGILVARGYIDAPTDDQINSLASGLGAALTIVPIVWSLIHKQKVDKAIETALEMPNGTSKEQLREKLDRT